MHGVHVSARSSTSSRRPAAAIHVMRLQARVSPDTHRSLRLARAAARLAFGIAVTHWPATGMPMPTSSSENGRWLGRCGWFQLRSDRSVRAWCAHRGCSSPRGHRYGYAAGGKASGCCRSHVNAVEGSEEGPTRSSKLTTLVSLYRRRRSKEPLRARLSSTHSALGDASSEPVRRSAAWSSATW